MAGRTFFGRTLPKECISFMSEEGKMIFREALDEGNMECYFPLAAHFHTQSEPAFCGLGSLVVVLNALRIDPERTWKGPWRFYSEDMLDCCLSLEVVKEKGITFDQFSCISRCNGALCSSFRPFINNNGTFTSPLTIDIFRQAVLECCASKERFLIASYDRKVLGQTGTGHFSPVGGFCRSRDMALLLDTARFKYPPHWIKIESLFLAMQSLDPETNQPRGWAVVSANPSIVSPSLIFRIGSNCKMWNQMVSIAQDLFQAMNRSLSLGLKDPSEFVNSLFKEILDRQDLSSLSAFVSPCFGNDTPCCCFSGEGQCSHGETQNNCDGLNFSLHSLHKDVRSKIYSTTMFSEVSQLVEVTFPSFPCKTVAKESLTLMLLACQPAIPQDNVSSGILELFSLQDNALKVEIQSLRESFKALWESD